MTVGRDVGQKFIDDLEADLRVRHFAALELERDLDLHVFAQKIDRVLKLDAEIMRVDARAQLDFLHRRSVLMLARFLFLLREFVAEFADLDKPADRRDGIGRNLDQIHALLARERQGVVQGKHPKLLVVVPDDADFAGTDFPVHTHLRGGGRIATRGIRAAQATLTGWD